MESTRTDIIDDSSDEESTLEQFVRLHKYLERAKKKKAYTWDVVELLNHFTAANGYQLNEDEADILFDDMKATADLLEAAEAFIDSKHGDKFSADAKIKFENALTCACNMVTIPDTMNTRDNRRDIFSKISIGLSIVALGAAAAVLAAGLSPFIITGCLVASVALLAASAMTHYYQTNCTFFGQTQLNHMLMTDLIVDRAAELEPKAVRCVG